MWTTSRGDPEYSGQKKPKTNFSISIPTEITGILMESTPYVPRALRFSCQGPAGYEMRKGLWGREWEDTRRFSREELGNQTVTKKHCHASGYLKKNSTSCCRFFRFISLTASSGNNTEFVFLSSFGP